MPQPESMDRSKEEGVSPALEEKGLSKWISRATHAALLLGISTVAAFVVSPTLYGQQIPDLGPDEIGKPFHSNLPSGFKAGRDYEIINEAVTEQRRQEARSSVRPVYDFNPTVLSELKQTVHDAFAAMQDVIAQVEKEPSVSKTSAAEERPSPLSGRKSKKIETQRVAGEEILPSRLRMERRNFEQKLLQVEDEDFI